MFSQQEQCSMGSGEVFIHLWGNGGVLFLQCNLVAGCWWDSLEAILGLITFCLCHDSLGQNSFDLWVLVFQICCRGELFWLLCSRYRFTAREE